MTINSDERAIRDMHGAWMAAVNEGALEPLLAMMTEDVVYLSPGQAPTGRAAFIEAFQGGHRDFALRCVSELLEIAVAGDVATTLCRDKLHLTPRAGGPAVDMAGHRLTVYRRQQDGSWRLARDAHTLMPA